MKASKFEKTWIPATMVRKETGWTVNEIRNLRRYGLIETKSVGPRSLRYSLESIKEYLEKKGDIQKAKAVA